MAATHRPLHFTGLRDTDKNTLLTLCNEATSPHEADSLDASFDLLYCRFSGSKSRVFAFLLECFDALGWNRGQGRGKLQDQLRADFDGTFSLESSFPSVFKLAKNDLCHKGLQISDTLNGFDVELIRLSLLDTILDPLHTCKESKPETFYEMFMRLLSSKSSESASIIYLILKYF